ncbi:hypothetical protein M8J76_010411 [Diaphorina citri]|nr:hypothetical protein M8J76_010411 [Diaphorina citri]
MAARHGRDLLSKREKRNRERKNLSFIIVILFFIIFCVIVLTEILVMEDRNKKPLAFFTSQHRRSVLDYDERQVVYEDAELYKDIVESARLHTNGKSSASNSQSVLPTRDNLTALDAVWQTVPGTRFKFYVYSAHYDDRKSKVIRVIGASKTRATEKVWCRYWYGDNSSKIITAKTKVIRENWNMKYSALFILCPVDLNTTLPASLSVVHKLRLPIRNHLLVRNNRLDAQTDSDSNFYSNPNSNHNSNPNSAYYNPNNHNSNPNSPYSNANNHNPNANSPYSNVNNPHYGPNSNFIPNSYSNVNNPYSNKKPREETMVVCVKPLHFTYDKVLQMLEFLELNRLLGASHVNFYVNSVSDSIACILNAYKNQTTPYPYVSTYEWRLNMVSQKEIRTEGLFAALNDCLYRNMYRHSYIVFIDLDEFIVPKHNTTLVELIHWLSKHLSTHSIGSYSFQNAFFYLQWPNDDSIRSWNRFETGLVSIAKTKRKAKLHPHKQRSKYIIRPEFVVEVGNHFVWEFLPGHASLNVPQNAGILHHYRICEFGGNDCIKKKYVEDRTAHRYKSQLLASVEAVYRRYERQCGLDVF